MKLQFNRETLFRKTEYPARYRKENLLKTVSILFGIIFVFLLLYKPFGVYEPELKLNYVVICGLHALIPAMLVYIYFSLFNAIRAKYTGRGWSNLKEYLHVSVVFLLIGTASFLIRDVIYTNPDNWSLHYAWEEIRNCYLAGILFYAFAALTTRNKQSINTAAAVPTHSEADISPQAPQPAAAPICIRTNVKADDFSFIPDELLFAKAEGNYIELTMFRNKVLSTELKRISLSQFADQVSACPEFFRCHRAYVVNMKQVKKASGNSQGYQLSFADTDKEIPVSRAQVMAFDSHHTQLSAISQ